MGNEIIVLVLLDIMLFLLVSISWGAAVFIIGWPLRRFVKQLDNMYFDFGLLGFLFFLNPFISYLGDPQIVYSIDVITETWIYLPVAMLLIYWVHSGSENEPSSE